MPLGYPELQNRPDVVSRGDSIVVLSPLTACITALPTTTAPQYIWNGEPVGGKHLVIHRISWMCTTSAGAAGVYRMMYCLGNSVVTQPATTDTLTTASLNGKIYSGRIGMGHAAGIANTGWVAIGSCFETIVTTSVGAGLDAYVDGGVIVPPGYLLSLACIAVNTTAVGRFAVTLDEIRMENRL